MHYSDSESFWLSQYIYCNYCVYIYIYSQHIDQQPQGGAPKLSIGFWIIAKPWNWSYVAPNSDFGGTTLQRRIREEDNVTLCDFLIFHAWIDHNFISWCV